MKITIIMSIFIAAATSLQAQSLHDFKVEAIDGSEFDLSQLKGKKVLVVNTASKCGLTPQYKNLEVLYKEHKDNDFVIIGFPANNFLSQEPGSNEEIAEFCQINYGVTFPMMAKVSVKGKDMHPLYQWLTKSTDSKVSWNFQKYMIGKDGQIEGFVSPKTSPQDNKILEWINN